MKYYLELAHSDWFGVWSNKYCPIWDDKLNELLDKYSDTAELKNSYVLPLGILQSGFQIDSMLMVI